MVVKEGKVKSVQHMKKYQMHNFIRKTLQKSVFDKLIEYIKWRLKKKKREKFALSYATPISINLDLTTSCNYYCDHCVDLDIINNGHSLKFANINNIISKWVDNGLKSVIIIGGGEPVLHPDFEKIISFLKSKDLELGIASNGSKISRLANIAHLLDSRDWVRLSLDAGTNDTFQKIHRPRIGISLEQILAEVKKMRKQYNAYQMGFSFLILSDDQIANNKILVNNIKEIALASKKAGESGFSYFSIKPFISPQGLRPTNLQEKFVNEIKNQIKLAKEFANDHFKIRESPNLLALFNSINDKLMVQPKICHIQFFRVVVAPDGIFNCSLWRGFDKNYVIDTQQEINEQYFQKFQDELLERLENFDSSKECNQVSCIYNDFNWFIEDMINNPEKIKYLEKTEDFYDYFL